MLHHKVGNALIHNISISCLTILYLFCSKKEKQYERMHEYWWAKVQMYANRYDETPETDSQDSADHLCRPTDPRAAASESPPKNY